MNLRLTQPWWLLLLALLPWVWWVTRRSWAELGPVRRPLSLALRMLLLAVMIAALGGLQWLERHDALAVIYALDRSLSIPAQYEQELLRYVSENAALRDEAREDHVGLLVFGGTASLELPAEPKAMLAQRIFSVVTREATDLAGALRLASAAFPEHVQKRVVLISDGNATQGDVLAEVREARAAGISVDVVPVIYRYEREVMVERVEIPGQVQQGERFDARIYVDAARPATARLWLTRNGRRMDAQEVQLVPGKNVFSLEQTLEEAGFYRYEVFLDSADDAVPQNNRALGYTSVAGEPRILYVESEPEQAGPLLSALQQIRSEIVFLAVDRMPDSLAELQDFDVIVLGNVSAGSLSMRQMRMLQSAARDFGVGVVVIGGNDSFTAGGYRGTPLEEMLPVSMDLSSKKVQPSGALVLIMHTTEFPGGNDWARQTALASLEALGPRDQMGVLLWAGQEQWLFDVQPVGDKLRLGRLIQGMAPGDMPDFDTTLDMAHQALVRVQAHLKHIVVFSDGDPTPPSPELVNQIVADKITVSTVMIGPHPGTNGPEKMNEIAQWGRGRYWDVRRPEDLPQIFIKEAAVILKSSIFEEPFQPQLVDATEPLRGVAGYPPLRGYVATTPKPRADVPLVSDKSDPVLAHWQYGLGRTVAFTSDAKPKWASAWIGWDQFAKFWTQIARWSFRRLDPSSFDARVEVQGTEGRVAVDALDERGNFLNFLTLLAYVVDPDGQRQEVALEQTGPGQYEGRFAAGKVGAYIVNLAQLDGGQVKASQVVGTALAYSPEFRALAADTGALRQIAEGTGGRVLDRADSPFEHDRVESEVPRPLFDRLLAAAIMLLLVDVGVRRVMLEPAQVARVAGLVAFWRRGRRPVERDRAMTVLLEKKEEIRRRGARRPAGLGGPPAAAGPAPEPPPKVERGRRAAPQQREAPPPPEPPTPEPDVSYTKKLLEAKRRAQRERGPQRPNEPQ